MSLSTDHRDSVVVVFIYIMFDVHVVKGRVGLFRVFCLFRSVVIDRLLLLFCSLCNRLSDHVDSGQLLWL